MLFGLEQATGRIRRQGAMVGCVEVQRVGLRIAEDEASRLAAAELRVRSTNSLRGEGFPQRLVAATRFVQQQEAWKTRRGKRESLQVNQSKRLPKKLAGRKKTRDALIKFVGGVVCALENKRRRQCLLAVPS